MRKLGNVFTTIGMLLLLAAFLLTLYNIHDDNRAKKHSQDVLQTLISETAVDSLYDEENVENGRDDIDQLINSEEINSETEETIPDYKLDPNRKMPVRNVEGQNYIGILEIPDLSLSLPVMGDWDYPKLKISPCRYTGSAYLDNLVIMAHNFASHFGGLSNLSYQSQVNFTDMDGNVFTYQVSGIEILAPTDVSEVTHSNSDLTLFTCTIGGESRVTVRCDRKD